MGKGEKAGKRRQETGHRRQETGDRNCTLVMVMPD